MNSTCAVICRLFDRPAAADRCELLMVQLSPLLFFAQRGIDGHGGGAAKVTTQRRRSVRSRGLVFEHGRERAEITAAGPVLAAWRPDTGCCSCPRNHHIGRVVDCLVTSDELRDQIVGLSPARRKLSAAGPPPQMAIAAPSVTTGCTQKVVGVC